MRVVPCVFLVSAIKRGSPSEARVFHASVIDVILKNAALTPL